MTNKLLREPERMGRVSRTFPTPVVRLDDSTGYLTRVDRIEKTSSPPKRLDALFHPDF